VELETGHDLEGSVVTDAVEFGQGDLKERMTFVVRI
jgi:hypothetical protein